MIPVECQNMWSQNTDSEKYFNTSELSLTSEESEESATIMSDLSTYLEESLIKYLIGDLSMDDWGTFQDTGDLVTTGIKAMLKSLDPYTVYYPESEMEDVKLMTTGEYEMCIRDRRYGGQCSGMFRNRP